jgi:carbon-monoxide dehydrogenase iron sulfur subunit
MKIIKVDPQRCTGCRSCEIACSFENLGECNPSRARIHIISDRIRGINLPLVCQQCRDAPCKAACPTGALAEDPVTHAVVVHETKCIGCRQCVLACPFGAIDVYQDMGHSFKCNLCNGTPQCVEACEEDALTFVEEARENRDKNWHIAEILQKIMQSQGEDTGPDFSGDTYTEWKKVV